MIPAPAVEAAARKMFSKWDELPESSKEHLYPDVRAMVEAAAPHILAGALNLADKWQEDFPYKANELRAALGVTND